MSAPLQDIDDMIASAPVECSVRAIDALLDIVAELNKRIDHLENKLMDAPPNTRRMDPPT